MTKEKEIKLVEKLRSPETKEEGFRELMLCYQERMYWHIRKFVDQHEDANDIIQNSFIKIYKGIDRFQGNSSIYTWMYKIASNEALSFIQKKKRKMHEIHVEDQSYFSGKAVNAFDVSQARPLLDRAIQTLPEKQKLVFKLRYFEELAYAEISNQLETSVGALKASYHHAVKKIEQFLLSNIEY